MRLRICASCTVHPTCTLGLHFEPGLPDETNLSARHYIYTIDSPIRVLLHPRKLVAFLGNIIYKVIYHLVHNIYCIYDLAIWDCHKIIYIRALLVNIYDYILVLVAVAVAVGYIIVLCI